ncbi:MAG: MMPL family transporter, partial [Acidimicrobiales bacterium]
IDYNIFLLGRARQEVVKLGPTQGMLRALSATGGVLTSAGVVLAGTFAVLAVLPLLASREIGIIVAAGVLLDTLVVRTILIPAVAIDMGSAFWWPLRLPPGT